MSQGNCANCKIHLADSDCTGASGLYNPGKTGQGYLLCEPCWLAEEDLVDESGTNNHPDKIKHYEMNQPGGYR